MYSVKCSNPNCDQVFNYDSVHYEGGLNDKGIIVVKCEKCGTIQEIRVENPETVIYVEGAKIIRKKLDYDDDK